MFNKKVILSTDGTSATVADATASDVFTTLVESNSGVTGFHGIAQKAMLFGGGLVASNKVHSGQFFNFGSKQLGVNF